jgi:N-ethylmaleimide reductase
VVINKEDDMSLSMLFSGYTLGDIVLDNRLVMAPMTRCRAVGNIPGDLEATYYAQRAEAGLIITEGISPSPNGLGYPRIPGLFSTDQTAAWKRVVDAVHAKGGRLFAQLMHTGRVGHPLNLPPGAEVLGPSPVAAPDMMYTDTEGMQPVPIPKEMTEEDIAVAIDEYVLASENAVAAGFDGVELHGANGYLIDQFINTASNRRADKWGRSIEGRTRFALSVAEKAAAAIGSSRIGIRLSPAGGFNGMNTDADAVEVYTHLAGALSKLGLVYVHLVDHSTMGTPAPSADVVGAIRENFNSTLILSGGYDAKRAASDLVAGKCELVAFGKPFIANPRLPLKFKSGEPLVSPDMETFYTPGPRGYTDYPL